MKFSVYIFLLGTLMGCSYNQARYLDGVDSKSCDLDSFLVSLPQIRIIKGLQLAEKIDSISSRFSEVTEGEMMPFIRVDPHVKDSFVLYKLSITRAYAMEFCENDINCELVDDLGLGVFWHNGILVKLNGTFDSYGFTAPITGERKYFIENTGSNATFYSYVCLDNNQNPILDLSLSIAAYYRETNGEFTLYYSE